MKKRTHMGVRWALACMGVAGLLAAVVLSLPGTRRTADRHGDGSGSEAARRYSFPKGKELVYAITLSGRDRTVLEVPGSETQRLELDGKVDLAGRLRMRLIEQRGGAALVGLSLEGIDRYAHEIAGKHLVEPGQHQTLAGSEVVVQMDARGSVQRVLFAQDTPEGLSALMQMVVPELQVVLGQGSRWRQAETGARGTSVNQYNVREADEQSIVLHKQRTRYASLHLARIWQDIELSRLEGQARAQWLRVGYLKSLESTELVQADAGGSRVLDAKLSVTLELLEVRDCERGKPQIQPWIAAKPGSAPVTEDASKALLLEQAQGMTAEELADTLVEYAGAGRVPNHNRFLRRAAGYLALHPQACAELAELFQLDDGNTASRGLIADLLVMTGHTEAQRALRDALASGAAAADPGRHLLFQRLGLVRRPDAATVEMIEEATRGESGRLRTAATYSLGAVASSLAATGDMEEAERLNRTLVDRLAASRDTKDVEHLLASVGNVGLEDNVAVVADYAKAEEPAVRVRAARALRLTQTPRSEEALFDLVQDVDGSVRAAAIRTLAEYQLSEQTMGRITDVVKQGQGMDEATMTSLFGVLRTHQGADVQQASRDLARAMLERGSIADPQLRAQLQGYAFGLPGSEPT